MNTKKISCLLEVASKFDVKDFALDKTNKNKVYVATMLKNLEPLGFTFSKKLINSLADVSKQDLTTIYNTILPILKKLKGAHVAHKPMYPNFPTQVMDADQAELYLNAIIHYLGIVLEENVLPEYPKEERSPLIGNYKLAVIEIADKDEYTKIINSLLTSSIAISEQQKAYFVDFYEANKTTFAVPDIKNKEIASYVAGVLYKDKNATGLKTLLKTPTDILRFVTALSDGDVSLAENTKFKNLKRAERRLLLNLLNGMKDLPENMVKHRNKWLRVGEILHPGDFSKQFKKIYRAFKSLRQEANIETFHSKVEAFLEEGRFDMAADLLSERPTELARRLDHLVRNAKKTTPILTLFKKTAIKVPTSVLLNIRSHFQSRTEIKPTRIFFPKGNVSKVKVIEKPLPVLDADICNKVVEIIETVLVDRFAQEKKWGNVYISEELRDINVPFALRSASTAFKTVARGSRIAIPGDKKVIRLFTWWKNGLKGQPDKKTEDYYDGSRIDIDLSSQFLDENFEPSGHVSWTSLRMGRGEDNISAHSGDITNAPQGASEFIDINIEKAVKAGNRYAVITIHSFTGQTFAEMKECFAGVMLRNDLKSGEAFDAKTVTHKFDLTSASTSAIPLLFDLQTRELIWLDLTMPKRNNNFGRTVQGDRAGLTAIVKGITDMEKPTLYDLFTLHAKGRGKIVKTREEAKKIFDLDYSVNNLPEILTLI